MNTANSETAFEALCARLAAGEFVRSEDIPLEWRDLPRVQRLLQLARVLQGMAVHEGTELLAPVSVPADAISSGQRLGVWQLLKPLGAGGMGQVWLAARTDGTAHQVAIKFVRDAQPTFVARLALERQILARLSHPNIARFIDAGINEHGSPWLALEYVQGQTLSAWCQQNRPSLRQRLEMFLNICAAVEHAHRHLVVHRDLKPSNVMVNVDGEPRLLDFGIAKLLDSSNEFTASALTPAYAAPEQIRGQTITTSTDVYALGLMLFRLLAGALPSKRESNSLAQVLLHLDAEETQRISRTAAAHQSELPYEARLLQGDLDAIVSKAMRAAPEARFGSVAEFAADLRRYLNGLPVLARTPTLGYRSARFVRRNRLAVALGVIAMLGVVSGAGLALWQAHLAGNAAVLAAREANKARQAAKTAERVTEFTLKTLSQMNPHGRATTQIKTGAELIQERIDAAKVELQDDPKAQARILSKLAEMQSILGSTSDAEATLKYALSLVDLTDPEEAIPNAQLRYTLATVLIQQQRFDEAGALLLQSLPSFVSDPALQRYYALGYSNLALIARNTGRTELAVERLAKAYELARIAYGAAHANTIELLSNRAMLLMDLERWDEAKQTLEHAVNQYESHQGPDFPRLVLPLVSLANLQERFGDHLAAKAGCNRAMQIAKLSFSIDDPQFARYRHSCAQTMLRLGDFAQVDALVRASAAAETGRPEVGFRNAFALAELHLLKHEFLTAAPHLARAQAIQQSAPVALKNDLPRLKALAALLDAARGQQRDQELQLPANSCETDALLCAAIAATWQRQGQAEQGYRVFADATKRLQAEKMSLTLFGAYQLLLCKIAVNARQVDVAKRWLSLTESSFSAVSPDSDWWEMLEVIGNIQDVSSSPLTGRNLVAI